MLLSFGMVNRTVNMAQAFLLLFLFPAMSLFGQTANLIFLGENIITMDGTNVAAVAVAEDRILAVGSREEVLRLAGNSTRIVELGERALLPGFIDAHGHFSGVARNAELLDLSPPPVGQINTIEDIIKALRAYIEQRQIPAGETVFGFGYDDSLLAEQRHPSRDDLDLASSNHPIIIRHVSGHFLAANSQALNQAGVSALTSDPSGGVIRRRADSTEPNGVMEETAMQLFSSAGGNLSTSRTRELQDAAIEIYAGYGITTIQDSNVSQQYAESMKQSAQEIPFPVDIVGYVMANNLSDLELESVMHESEYQNGYRVGGIKFTLDGSPQGRTAWMSQPYAAGPPGADASYVAYPSYDPDAFLARMPGLLERGIPVLAHTNGDAAIELLLDGVEAAVSGLPIPDHRSVAIHAQLVREDQLDRIKRLGIIPSYYSVHPYFWGDWHRLSFGDSRANFISPVRATIDREIPFTIHNDSPVVPPDMMRLVAITVNRATRSGYILGPEQRATVMEALYAITQGAAYQYFEEARKGSITPGKRADLVILEQNPLQVDPGMLAEIGVVETIAGGKTVYLKP